MIKSQIIMNNNLAEPDTPSIEDTNNIDQDQQVVVVEDDDINNIACYLQEAAANRNLSIICEILNCNPYPHYVISFIKIVISELNKPLPHEADLFLNNIINRTCIFPKKPRSLARNT